MSEVRIAAEPRTEFGKGGARRTRRAGKVPAVLYGHGESPRHISLPARELARALKTDAGFNVLLRLELDGGTTELALPKALQRDPLRGDLEHLDLLLVRSGEKVTVDIEVKLVGEADRDGLVDLQTMTLSVLAEATHIPDSVEVSIQGLRVGALVTAADVKLPTGTVLGGDPEQVIVAILGTPTAEQLDAELDAAAAELAPEPTAGETAAAAEAEGDDAEPAADQD